MRDVTELPWRTVVGITLSVVVLFVAAQAVRGSTLVTATFAVGYPVAAIIVLGCFALIKHRYT